MFDELKKVAQSLWSFLTPARKVASDKISQTEKAQGDGQTLPAYSTEQEYAVNPLTPLLNDKFSQGRERAALDSWDMYFKDDRVRTGIRINTELITQRGVDGKPFNISVMIDNKDEADEIREEIESAFKAVKLYGMIDALIRATLIEGSRFQRLIFEVDGAGNPIKVVDWKPLAGPRKDFALRGPIVSEDPRINGGYLHYSTLDRRAVNFLFRWEVCPFHWDYDLDTGWGVPLVSSGRTNFERLFRAEKSVAQARIARGYNRLGFLLNAQNRNEYRELVADMEAQRKKLGNEDIFSDVYVKGDVKTLTEGSSTIFNIDDVRYSEHKLKDSLLVPRGLYPSGGENVNRAVLQVQHENWINGVIRDGEAVLESGLQPFVAAVLLTMDRVLAFTPVHFNWPPKHLIDAPYVQALRDARKSGDISGHTYLQLGFKTNWERERALLEQENAELAEDAERLAQERENKMKQSGANEGLNDDVDIEDDDIDVQSDARSDSYYARTARLAVAR